MSFIDNKFLFVCLLQMVEASGMCTDHHEKKSVDVNKYKDLFTSETRVSEFIIKSPFLAFNFTCSLKS